MSSGDNSSASAQPSRRKSLASGSSSAGASGGAGGAPAADSIKVVCRFRPPKQIEIEKYGQSSKLENFTLDTEAGVVEAVSDVDRRSYAFDKLFGIDTQQEDIFHEIQGTVESIMEGFNGTVLAYGQTSSGKTHTMEGPSLWDTKAQGVIPRTIDKIFGLIQDADESNSFTVAVSYYEVYNEKIRDLLNPSQDDLKMREYPNKADGWFIQDVTEAFCADRDSVIRLIETGKTFRATAATLMNADSSRSHSIMSILVSQKNEVTGRNRKGRLFLVDLAGSEKISKTGATGQTKKEAIGINISLTTLGMVINALCDGSSHIPYRDSKLTLILKNSLGGNSKTTLIICCASEARHTLETISTLRFGERAKRIKNNARVNEELGVAELKKLLQIAQKEIADLKKTLTLGKAPGGVVASIAITNDAGEAGAGSPKGEADDIAVSLRSELEEADRELELAAHPSSGADFGANPSLPSSSSAAGAAAGQDSAAVTEQLNSAVSRLDEVEAEAERLKIRIRDLEEELEMERIRANIAAQEKTGMEAEINAYQSTIAELEDKLLEAKMASKPAPPPLPAASEATGEGHDMTTERDSSHRVSGAGQEEGGEDDFGDRPAALDSIKAESEQLRSKLEKDISSLEESLSDREKEAKNANMLAAEYAEKYARLKDDFDSQIQRLVLKLSLEQQARAEVEQRIDNVSPQLWVSQSESSDANAGKSFFSKLFGGGGGSSSGGSYGSGGGSGGGSRLSMLIPAMPSFAANREVDLNRKLEHAQIKLSHAVQELESTKEAQRIVLETKESVMRSLLKQNSQIQQERDVMARRIEDLTATVEQLTGLLRSIQNRRQKSSSSTSPTAPPSGASNSAPSAGAAPGAASNVPISISGGGRSHHK